MKLITEDQLERLAKEAFPVKLSDASCGIVIYDRNKVKRRAFKEGMRVKSKVLLKMIFPPVLFLFVLFIISAFILIYIYR